MVSAKPLITIDMEVGKHAKLNLYCIETSRLYWMHSHFSSSFVFCLAYWQILGIQFSISFCRLSSSLHRPPPQGRQPYVKILLIYFCNNLNLYMNCLYCDTLPFSMLSWCQILLFCEELLTYNALMNFRFLLSNYFISGRNLCCDVILLSFLSEKHHFCTIRDLYRRMCAECIHYGNLFYKLMNHY